MQQGVWKEAATMHVTHFPTTPQNLKVRPASRYDHLQRYEFGHVRACSYNQKSSTKNSCTFELLVCKFWALNFSSPRYVGFQSRKMMPEVAKWLQGFVM